MTTGLARWGRTEIVGAALLALLGGWLWWVPPVAAAGVPLPALPLAKGERCVEPTELMRREHMRLLSHQRDRTVLEGVRTTRHSLAECVECHASRDARGQAVRINAPGQFCESCHSYAGVRMDCFECHAAKPRQVGIGDG